MPSRIPPEFTMDRAGKTFVLYSGLLDLAHDAGLKRIESKLIQVPSEENGNTAICQATVEMEDGRIFTDVGDANAGNVGRNIVPHAMRMASTRAKARALRDATNIGMTALEELGDDDGDTAPSQPRPAPRREPSPGAGGSSGGGGGSGAGSDRTRTGGGSGGGRTASEKQINYVKSLIKAYVPGGREVVEKHYGKPLEELTSQEASETIKRLTEKNEK